MRKKILFTVLTLAIVTFAILQPQLEKYEKLQKHELKKLQKREDFAALSRQQYLMLRDPATEQIPKSIYALEKEFIRAFPIRLMKGQELAWVERGPNNISGRVRSLGIDVRTAQGPNITIITGGVSGGLWKSTNNGDNWFKTTTSAQLHAVTHMLQDTRPGKQDIWYAGSGESVGGTSASGGYIANYLGDGIFKSTDNGNSWNLLASTSTNNPSAFSSDWQYVWRLAIDKSNTTQDVVFAATTGGVYRTQNGGTSWTKVLTAGANLGFQDVPLDIATADNGTVYVAAGSVGGAENTIKGIRKSTDGGENFSDITPVNMPENYGRIVFSIAPSNNDVLYFLVQGTSGNNSTPSSGKENCQLWRSSDAGATWTNISSVIPESAPDLENFQTQGGYDMLLSVKPDNPNFVIFGGVSLFKVHDVLNDNMSVAEKHIGGYGITGNGTANALNDFINQHPDQHYGYFLPGNNNVFYCANDGGIHIANDISKTTDMRNFWLPPKRAGLNISQLFSIAIAPEAGSGYLAGGFQDRGNWLAKANNAGNTPANWSEQTGGDGTICAIAPDALNTVFQATTEGNIFRYAKSETVSPLANTTAIKPTGATNLQFVNPFTLDPNNGNLLYFAGGQNSTTNSGIWRNTSATTATETVGWQFLANSEVTNSFVSAISVSNTNSANVLYYGTSDGKVYRIDNADSGNPDKVDITGTGFPAGYVNCIAIDPTNSANAIAVFSNYNVDRLWYTTNSGTSWTSISGNLTGAGAPSVRWAKIIYFDNKPMVFLATSTGLYKTNNLTDATTSWSPEAQSSIGNVVCVMLDYRASDNTLVVATHGRGAFEAKITTSTATAPAAPSNLVATTESESSIKLQWKDNATDETGYKIDRKRTAQEQWTLLAIIDPNSISYTDNNLTDGSKYYYRIYAFNAIGNSNYSDEVNSITTMKAPTNLSVESSSNSKVQLKWNDNSESEDGYTVERKVGQSGQYQKLKDVNANTTTLEDDAVIQGQVYFYKIRAFNSNITSAYSNEVSVTITDVAEIYVIPSAFELSQNYPNPFNPSTIIKFALPKASNVQLKIYDLNGQLVSTLVNEVKSAGYHSVRWSGKDSFGKNVASGIYLYVIDAAGYRDTKKMLLIK